MDPWRPCGRKVPRLVFSRSANIAHRAVNARGVHKRWNVGRMTRHFPVSILPGHDNYGSTAVDTYDPLGRCSSGWTAWRADARALWIGWTDLRDLARHRRPQIDMTRSEEIALARHLSQLPVCRSGASREGSEQIRTCCPVRGHPRVRRSHTTSRCPSEPSDRVSPDVQKLHFLRGLHCHPRCVCDAARCRSARNRTPNPDRCRPAAGRTFPRGLVRGGGPACVV